jgi:hypothetical protein
LPVCLPGRWRIARRKPWDSNPQAGQPAARVQDGSLIRPVGFRRPVSSGGRDRTCGLLGQSQASLPAATAPESVRPVACSDTHDRPEVRGVGRLEPPPSGSRPEGLPSAEPRECPAGVEPACPAWGAGASPARPRARSPVRGAGIEPASPGWKPGVLPLNEPRILTAEGVGLEPTRLIARPRSRRVPSRQVGLPFPQPTRSTGGRNRTCELLLNQ